VSDRPPGADAREVRGPVLRKGVGIPASGWIDPRGRALGGFAFSANRVTGLGLVFYLYLHLGVLSLLLGGERSWNDFIRLATSWAFLSLDVLLILGILYHGLNGIRVALVGSGIVADQQRALWWSLGAVGTIALIAATLHIIGSR
jgi:succinate dehydrogenase / fumarate reductase, cytochrome b subunit